MTWPLVLETIDGFEGLFFQDSYNNLTSSVFIPQIPQHHTFIETQQYLPYNTDINANFDYYIPSSDGIFRQAYLHKK